MSGARIIVSNDPNDASILMHGLSSVVEQSMFIGKKYPLLDMPTVLQWSKHTETKGQYAIRVRDINKNEELKYKLQTEEKKRRDVYVSSNKYGYWDNPFYDTGIVYDIEHKDILNDIKQSSSMCSPILKLSFASVSVTDPSLVFKMIIIIKEGKYKKYSTYLNKLIKLLRWVDTNKVVDVCCINYNDLIVNKEKTAIRISKFLELDFNIGEFVNKISDIKTSSLISKPIEVDINNLIYDNKYDLALDKSIHTLEEIEYNAETWTCERLNEKTNSKKCDMCMSSSFFRKSLKDVSNSKGIDWKKLPCVYECGYRREKDLISFDKSIANNFWLD